MPATYTVELVTDTTYIDQGGRPVSGFKVTYTIYSLNETHSIDVPRNDPKEIDARIKAEILKFEAVRKLGG